jgi:hypothetical protein
MADNYLLAEQLLASQKERCSIKYVKSAAVNNFKVNAPRIFLELCEG